MHGDLVFVAYHLRFWRSQSQAKFVGGAVEKLTPNCRNVADATLHIIVLDNAREMIGKATVQNAEDCNSGPQTLSKLVENQETVTPPRLRKLLLKS